MNSSLMACVNHQTYYRDKKSTRSNTKLQIVYASISYGIPLIVSLTTGIAESTLPGCSVWKPRFTEDKACNFAGKQ